MIRTEHNPAHQDTHSLKKSQKLETKLLKLVGTAISEFQMINNGDRVLVALSGGKDSYVLLDLLLHLQKKAPIDFQIEAVNLDPGYAGYKPEVVSAHARTRNVPIHLLDAPIEQMVKDNLKPGQAACPLCSRVRRGSFYTLARQLGFNTLALGHHLDDMLETVLLNMFYAGTLRGMPPKLDRNEPPTVIRPLCYVLEQDIVEYATVRAFPIIPCASPHCGADNRRRQVIKRMLSTLSREHADVKTHMRRALGNVQPDTLFDRRLTAMIDAG